ncbi:hypothetical protein PG997_000867 [Apiospora hydei]|uniref:Uncharacterized protein n=1 Tax=Apiospora hydei TaxID=1337664 RepID=A0ABR1XBY0_9PEZI
MNTSTVEPLCSFTTLVASQNIASSSTTTTAATTTTTTSLPPKQTTTITKEKTWQRRDIASLKTQAELEADGQAAVLWSGATGHPCIIMDLVPDGSHALVTAVSSFRPGPQNGYLQPWKQHCHQGKDPDRSRSFAGTERWYDDDGNGSSGRHLLHLEGGRQFPKSRTAWV